MKYGTLLFALTAIFFASCQGEDVGEGKECFVKKHLPPSSTRSATQRTLLEEAEECLLSNGEKIKLPWADNSSGAIPENIRKDVRECDGWRVLYSNVDILGYSEKVTSGYKTLNYLLLYNRYTGVLKGFTYINKVQTNNFAFWQLKVSDGSKLFSFAETYAHPLDDTAAPTTVITSNLTTNGITGGFTDGWNCFVQELAYDPTSSKQHLDISGFAMNKTTYQFTGDYNSTSAGTIVTSTGNSSDLLNGTVSATGDAAKGLLDRLVSRGKTESKGILASLSTSILSEGVKGVVSLGLYKIFGSVLGTTTTSKDLQFSTHGKVQFSGSGEMPGSGFFPPVQGIPLDGLGENLGLWNMQESPTYTVNNEAELVKIGYLYNYAQLYYRLKWTPKYYIVTNPAVHTNISSHLDVIGLHAANPYKYYNPDITATTEAVPVYNSWKFLYSTSDLTSYFDATPTYNVTVCDLLPNGISYEGKPVLNIDKAKCEVRTPVIFKILITNQTPTGNTVYSSKSFLPILQRTSDKYARLWRWRFEELIEKGF